jgi:HEXXH motif-containing protein
MKLTDQVHRFIKHPRPLWECTLTSQLVRGKWARLAMDRSISADNYSTALCLQYGDDPLVPATNRVILSADDINGTLYLESPAWEPLQTFYADHGLAPLPELEIASSGAWAKIKSALNLLDQVPRANDCVQLLVRCIQILSQADAEIDSSYSHPDIPFSIFVSVCADSSLHSALRVAESILHEAMHLKLTLIEGVTPLIVPNATGRYFSPWRNELRPAQGVMHGLFVFRAILDFYTTLVRQVSTAREIGYLQDRIAQITEEFQQLKAFPGCEDLTTAGATLTANLLPLN